MLTTGFEFWPPSLDPSHFLTLVPSELTATPLLSLHNLYRWQMCMPDLCVPGQDGVSQLFPYTLFIACQVLVGVDLTAPSQGDTASCWCLVSSCSVQGSAECSELQEVGTMGFPWVSKVFPCGLIQAVMTASRSPSSWISEISSQMEALNRVMNLP